MKLLFIGDSLIEYFDWQERFPMHAVYNMGIAGETVYDLYARIEVVFGQVDDPDLVFVMSGINNLATGSKNFIPSYRELVRKLKGHYVSSSIIVQSLLPVLFSWISNNDIRDMNIQLKKMAEEEDVLYLDIHSLFLGPGGAPVREYLLDDGVHISEKGYQIWAEEIEKLL
jgi:lysophospholipase L1-like esterase